MPPLAFDRAAMLRRLESDTFDVLVIGGGITGVGCALDAASRGLRTALVERDDFASGTSSKSSKFVHGGLRYLQQGEIRLVYEALHERHRLRRNAPHLVRVLPFMIPILTKDGVVSKKIARGLGSAMWMYDLTGGWRIGKLHRRLKAADALRHLPTMPADRLASAYLYFDAATDDARLCLAVARTAADHGAVVANGCGVVAITKDEQGEAIGAEVVADGRRFSVRATVVVNAAGVWADEVGALDGGVHPGSIRPAKGIHVTIPWEKVRNDIAVVIPVPKDKRSLFVVPFGPNPDGTFRHTYAGTTDTDYDGPLDDPQCTAADLDYVLRALNASVTTTITRDDITGTWAGLRPLVNAGSLGEDGRSVPATPHRDGVERCHQRHGGQADDLPGDGRGHDRPGGRPARARTQRPLPHEATPPPWGRWVPGHGTVRLARRPPRRAVRYGGGRRAGLDRRRSLTRRGARTRASLRSGRSRVRGAPRDGAARSTIC